MKKRQALKILKKCRNILFKDDSVLGRRYWRAFKCSEKLRYKDIKRKIKIEFSKPLWQNLTICGPVPGYKIGDVEKDLIAFGEGMELKAAEFWENNIYECFEQPHLRGYFVDED